MTREDRSNAVTMGLLGTISGIVAWITMHVADVLGNFRFSAFGIEFVVFSGSTTPGLVFGVIFAVVFHRHGKLLGFRQAGYVLAAGLAYFVAVHVAASTSDRYQTGTETLHLILSGIAAGLAGSVLLGLMTVRLLPAPASTVLLLPVAVGALTGAILGLMAYDPTDAAWSLLILFAAWQGSYAASLAPALRRAP